MAIFDYNYALRNRGIDMDKMDDKSKQAIILKMIEDQKAEEEKQNEIRSLSEALKSVNTLPRVPMYDQNIPVEQNPNKRAEMLNQQEQAMQFKQDEGGTFTDADLEPYKRAGVRSYGQQADASNPLGMYAQMREQGASDIDSKNAVALSQPRASTEPDDIQTARALQADPALAEEYRKMKETGKVDKDRIQILQTDKGYVEYNKDTKEATPLGIQRPLTDTQKDDLVKLRNVQDALKSVVTNYKEEYTGPWQGGIAGSTYKKLGIGTSEAEQTYRQDVSVLNQMLYALSGKQVSIPEFDRIIKPYIPQIGESDIEFKAKMKGLQNGLTQIEQNKVTLNTKGLKAFNEGKNTPQKPKYIVTREE